MFRQSGHQGGRSVVRRPRPWAAVDPVLRRDALGRRWSAARDLAARGGGRPPARVAGGRATVHETCRGRGQRPAAGERWALRLVTKGDETGDHARVIGRSPRMRRY